MKRSDLATRRLLLALSWLLIACNGDDSAASACLAELELECETEYEPTFENFHKFEIKQTCGTGGSLCHGPSGNKGNLTLDVDDADGAYDALVSGGLVIPGDPECSVLIQRLESEDRSFVMPQGRQLSDEERCSIRKWVANGAER